MSVEAVKAGELIEVTQPPDTRLAQMEVKPPCENKGGGHWYCVTHHEHFTNNFMKDTHIEKGDHRMAWICHEHGAEEP